MKEFKIRNKTYEIKEGDFIQDNGSCLLFFSGDNRVLRVESFTIYNYVVLPKVVSKKIKFDKLKKQELIKSGVQLTRYYFTKEFLEDERKD